MATRAIKQFQSGIVRPYTVAAGQTVTVGKTVKFASGSESMIQDAGAASDVAIGVVVDGHPSANASGVIAAGIVVEVIHPFVAIGKMLVGTGGSTAGTKQKVVSDGITDVTALGGGTAATPCVGLCLQTGVVGDLVGVGLFFDSRVNA